MTRNIPSYYRVFFTIIDPVIAASGVFANILAPGTILRSYSPAAVVPPTTDTTVLLDTIAGFLAGTILLQIVLLRMKPDDVAVWKTVQASILIVDLAMLGALGKALNVQHRLHPATWRPEEWTNIGITGGVALMRTVFCLGVGMGGEKTKEL